MNDKSIRLLLVEDDKVDQMAFERFVGSENLPYDYTIAGSVAEAKEILKSTSFDVIISDYRLGDGTSFELFDLFKGLPVIVTTGTGTEEVAVEAMKLGAYDYLMKDPEGNYLKTLPSTVELALKRKQTEKELRNYQENLESMVKERTAQLEAEIVERKHAEDALKLERDNLHNIFDSIEDGIYIVNQQCDIHYVNPVLVKEFGYYEGRKCYEYFHDRDEVCPWCKNQDVLAGKTVRWEWYSLKNEKTYDLIDTPMTLPDGSIGKLEIFRDISDMKQAEESLRESEEKHRLLADNTVDCIWKMNFDLEFTYINQAVFPFLGYTPEEWIGSKLTEHCSSEEIEKMQAIILDVLANLSDKTAEVFETTFYHKNGEEIPCEVSGKIVLDDAGNPIYLQGTTRDITERKNAIKNLRDSEEQLTQAVQGISIPTFIIDNSHIITHWNKACESLTGLSEAEMVGTKKQWLAFYAAERPVLADFLVDRATDEKIGRYYEGKHHKSILIEGAYEGENFFPNLGEKGKWLFYTAAPLRHHDGNIIGAIETFQDITEQKNLEAQFRQAQKMEAIGTLAGGIAHDFNNLLTTIIGNAQLALMDISKDDSLRKRIEEIKKAGDRSASLTRQLLAFSRKQVIRPEVLNLNEVINETEKMLKRMIGEDIEFQTILKPELWKVHMDSGQIDQIIINMAVNARDAISQGGKLTIETTNVDLDKNYLSEHGIEGSPGHYVMLAISDTGSGMNKETQEHIFEPFFTTKELGKGTGLGLSTVYGIAKQNNGFIWVYSEPGQGTTFKIYLPKVKGDAEAEEKERTPVGDLNGSETVLVVEDDDKLRNLARKILERYGYSVLKAENGEDALRVSEEYDGQIDLILTDVVMPKMSGKETAERLQSLRPDIKVIYMSGYTDDAIVHHGVLAPGLNFLEKPFTPEGLARKVREVRDDLN